MTQTCGCFPSKWPALGLKQAGKGLCKGVKRAARFIGKQLLGPSKPSLRSQTLPHPRDQVSGIHASGRLMPEGSEAASPVVASGLSSQVARTQAHQAASAASTCNEARSSGLQSAATIPNPVECETPLSQSNEDVFPGADANFDFSSCSIGHDGHSSWRLSSVSGCKSQQQSLEYLPTIHDQLGGSQRTGSRRPRAYSACISESSTLSGPATPARSDSSIKSMFSRSFHGLSGGRSSITGSSRGSTRRLSWLMVAEATARLHSSSFKHASTDVGEVEVTSEDGSTAVSAPENPTAASASEHPTGGTAPDDSPALQKSKTTSEQATEELTTPEASSNDSRPDRTTEELTTPEAVSHDSPPETTTDVTTPECTAAIHVSEAPASQDISSQKPDTAGAEETTPAQSLAITGAEEATPARKPETNVPEAMTQASAEAPCSLSVIEAVLELKSVHDEAPPADEDEGSAMLQRHGLLPSADAAAADAPEASIEDLLAAVSIASDGVVGFVNPRCCCYLNAVLQCLIALAAFVDPLRSGLVEQIMDLGLGYDGFEGQQVTEKVLELFTKVLARRAGDGGGPIVLDELRTAMSATDALDLQRYACAYIQQDAVEFIGELLRYLHANGLCFLDTVSSRELRITDNMTEQMCQMLAFECNQEHSWVSEAVASTVMTTWMCTECSKKGHRFGGNRVMLVSLPGGPTTEPVSLHDCLDATLNAEAEAFSCPDCKGPAVECGSAFSRLSDGFVIALKRYELKKGSDEYTKNQRPVTFSEELDLTPFSNIDAVEAMGGGGTKYSLCGICHHHGTTTAGHYWASTRALSDGRWRLYDDDKVLDWQCPAGPSETAYLLFYKRV